MNDREPRQSIVPSDRRDRAESLVRKFTGVALTTGAVPVPAASAAVVAENAAMVNAVAAAMGVPVSVGTVVKSMGPVGCANVLGKAVFMEGARLLSWGAGPGGMAAVSALGATTAGLQTWVLGQLTIAICEHGGKRLPSELSAGVVDTAKRSFDKIRDEVGSK